MQQALGINTLPFQMVQKRLMVQSPNSLHSQSLDHYVPSTSSSPAKALMFKPQAAFLGYDKANLDPTVRPQDDFNAYAIGGYLKTHNIPADKPAWGIMSQMAQTNQETVHQILESTSATAAPGSDEQKLHDFYHSGMDQTAIESAGLKPLQGEMDRIDGLQTSQDLQDEIAHLHASGLAGLFGFGSTQDAKNPSQVIGEATQGGLGMPDRDYYLKDDKAKVRTAYSDHVANMLTLAGDDPAKAKAEAQTVLAIETRLAQAAQDQVKMRDPNAVYNVMDRGQLAKLTPNFDWNRYFTNLGRSDIQSINVATPDYFKQMDGILKDVPLGDWKTYLRWQVLNQTASYLPKKFDDENFAFKGTVLTGVTQNSPRWQRVARATDTALGDAVGQRFVAARFSPEAKVQAKEMIENILDAARDKIKNGWMSDATKKAALDKVDHLTIKVGYPDKWADYSSMDVKPGPYAANALNALKYEAGKDLSKIGHPVDPTEFGMTAATVNAYYNPTHNEIVFPAGILQPPFFDPKADAATNYGAIGSVIGHELTHGFDDNGAQYDDQGRLRNWFTPADLQNFTRRADGVANQFSQFVFDGQHEDGKLVEGESIADLGGLELAWAAYRKADAASPSQAQDGFNSDQRFWLAHALCWATNSRPQYAHLLLSTDPHPLPTFRVNGPAADMNEFYQAFKRQPGDGMFRTPDQRNHLWNA